FTRLALSIPTLHRLLRHILNGRRCPQPAPPYGALQVGFPSTSSRRMLGVPSSPTLISTRRLPCWSLRKSRTPAVAPSGVLIVPIRARAVVPSPALNVRPTAAGFPPPLPAGAPVESWARRAPASSSR